LALKTLGWADGNTIKALLTLHQGSIKALLKLYEGSTKAPFKLYQDCIKANLGEVTALMLANRALIES